MNIKNYVESLIREKMLRDIENDRKEKEFIYYMVEKSKNDLLINALKNLDGVLDLRFAGSDWNGIVWKYLRRISDNEGFFECKLSGFIKVIKNVNELQMENGIDGHSNKAMYKIIGPNNEIVADNIQGYNEATRICEEISENYKKQVEEEFSKISMNK